MLYIVLSGVSSLRGLSAVMLTCKGKISPLNLKKFPKRNTLSDTNANHNSEVFASIYYTLLDKYGKDVSYSNSFSLPIKHLKIVDSTTISLFRDFLKGLGRNAINGKKESVIKMHTMINAMEDVPFLLLFSSAVAQDHTFLKERVICCF